MGSVLNKPIKKQKNTKNMIDKIFKNSKYMGIVTVITLVLVVALIWDDKKNPRKDFFGLLKSSTPATIAE